MNCAQGGIAVESGRDNNDNGELDASEITATSYVCSGSNGDAALVAIVAEPPGANCTAGGSAIESGIDANHNNVLDPNEVTSTTYLCNSPNPTTIEGSVTVQNALQAAQLVGVQHVTGNLYVEATGLTSLDLTSLVQVDGDLGVYHYSGSTISMPSLVSVGGGLYVEPQVASLNLDSLVSVGNALFSEAGAVTLPKLVTAETVGLYGLTSDAVLPVLASDSRLTVSGTGAHVVSVPLLVNAQFVTVGAFTLDAPVLQGVDTLTLDSVSDVRVPALLSATTIALDTTSLTSFPFSRLTSLTNVYMNGNPNAIQLSRRDAVMGDIEISGGPVALDLPNVIFLNRFVVEYSPAPTVGLPALRSTSILMLTGNSALTSLAFPALTSAAQLEITNNAALSQCAASSFADGISSPDRWVANNGPC